MKVSIVIPIYNAERYIERCIRSLFEQTYQDIEYVFIDDGSTDRSMEVFQSVLAEYPSVQERVKVFAHDTNKGCAMARWEGMKHATGESLIPVDSSRRVDLFSSSLSPFVTAKAAGVSILPCVPLTRVQSRQVEMNGMCQNSSQGSKPILLWISTCVA